jgi:hypothetical protein
MTTYQTIVPAYGRDYKSKKEVTEAWNSNVDFRCEPQGFYVNKQDAEKGAGTVFMARYKKLMQIMQIYPKK